MDNKTLEEAAEKANGYTLYAKETKGQAFNEGFIEGAKWQAEKMYSEEDMKKCWEASFHFYRLDGFDSPINFDYFIKQLKKEDNNG